MTTYGHLALAVPGRGFPFLSPPGMASPGPFPRVPGFPSHSPRLHTTQTGLIPRFLLGNLRRVRHVCGRRDMCYTMRTTPRLRWRPDAAQEVPQAALESFTCCVTRCDSHRARPADTGWHLNWAQATCRMSAPRTFFLETCGTDEYWQSLGFPGKCPGDPGEIAEVEGS
jgi:hypothetical protein